MTVFEQRRILFFCPKFFGYDAEIAKTMRDMGGLVDHFDERPANNFKTKVLLRLGFGNALQIGKTYYSRIISAVSGKNYDFIFFVSPETVTTDSIQQLRKSHPNAKFLLYTWDSFANKKKLIELGQFFDRCFTFDSRDALSHPRFSLRPLFYTQDVTQLKNLPLTYELFFCGTIHSDRNTIVEKFQESLSHEQLRFFAFKYCPSKILFFVRKLTDKNFRRVSVRDVNFTPMDRESLLKYMSESKCLLDINHPQQVGLTIRTLEALGSKRKLLTTNKSVVEFDFYDPQNIQLFDREMPQVDLNFLSTPFRDLPEEIFKKYSIKTWLHDIFFS